MKAIIAALAALGLAACAAQTARPTSVGQDRALDLSRLTGSAALARAPLAPGASYMPEEGQVSGVVLLTRDTKKSRAADMCEAWRRIPSTAAMTAETGGPINVTYWPVTRTLASDAACAELVQAYDYERGSAIASRFGALGPKGPGLVVVQDERAFFLVDMSKASGRNIGELMTNWYQLAVDESARGQASLTAQGGGGLFGKLGGVEGAACIALDAASLGIPIVDLAGDLLCKKAA